MTKKIKLAAVSAALAAASMAVATPSLASEGANSVGHGVKCYYFAGVQFCYKSI